MVEKKTSVSTGNPQMDAILNGGFPTNSINIIMGQPGTGKTVFAEQMIFHQGTAEDRPIVYLTTLSEPVAKVLTYLQRFEFYDDDKIGSSIHYGDIGDELSEKGIDCVVPRLEDLIHTVAPKIIVIDSFRALHDLAESTQSMRRMLHRMTGLLTAFETTVFLIGEYTEEQSRTLPEFAVADGIIQFLRNPQSTKDERFVRVLKLRGSSYLEGLHACRITNNGVQVFPRLITPDVPRNYEVQNTRVPSGVDGLDKIIGGGFAQGSATLLVGPSGAGKTTCGLQFALAGLNENKGRSLVLNFQENPTQLARSLMNLTGKEKPPEGLELIYMSPVEMQVDSVIVSLFRRIESDNIGRIVVDSIGDLAMATSDADRLHDFLYALVQHFAMKGVTSMLTFESIDGITQNGSDARLGRVSYMSDNIILMNLNHDSKPPRTITCIKARGTHHDLAAHEFHIAADGLHIH
ncbi:MAG TPA: ATPase domain-containing protein [Planktothrix sp.]|jgi:circadian clock protein KaiC